jgi:hypothetical protein
VPRPSPQIQVANQGPIRTFARKLAQSRWQQTTSDDSPAERRGKIVSLTEQSVQSAVRIRQKDQTNQLPDLLLLAESLIAFQLPEAVR